MPGFCQMLEWLCVLTLTVLANCVKASCPANARLTAPEGEILSPNYPNAYPINIRCNWTVSLHADQTIAFYLNDLNLPAPPSSKAPCSNDFLTFSEADTDPIVECGNKTNLAFTSFANEMLIEFTSDNQNSAHTGFNLSYIALGCVDKADDPDVYNITYDYNDSGEKTAGVQCVNGESRNSTCNIYKWQPSLSDIDVLCAPKGPVTVPVTVPDPVETTTPSSSSSRYAASHSLCVLASIVFVRWMTENLRCR